MHVCVCVRACVRVCVRACVRVCVRACVRACVCAVLLTSQPGGAVGLCRWAVQLEALGGQGLLVLWLLHQQADLSQEPVQEARQHGSATDHHDVLRQGLPCVYGTLRGGERGCR